MRTARVRIPKGKGQRSVAEAVESASAKAQGLSRRDALAGLALAGLLANPDLCGRTTEGHLDEAVAAADGLIARLDGK